MGLFRLKYLFEHILRREEANSRNGLLKVMLFLSLISEIHIHIQFSWSKGEWTKKFNEFLKGKEKQLQSHKGNPG